MSPQLTRRRRVLGLGQGLLVIKHRVEIARVEPTFRKVMLNRRRPMSTTREIA